MAENSKIEWCDHTFNPWIGCQKVGPGCDHCYAEALDKRTGGSHWGPKAERKLTSSSNWALPLRWNRQAEHGINPRVFCASMADVFDKAVPSTWRTDLWALIEETPRLRWQLLTKRVGNVFDLVPEPWLTEGWPRQAGLMITVVNQQEADRDVPKLLELKLRFGIPWVGLSLEPLLGRIDLLQPLNWHGHEIRLTWLDLIDWVIVGGESGAGARPMHPDWARSLRDQCAAAGVPFFMKQMGGPVKSRMPLIPDDLMVRQMPKELANG